MLCAKLVRRFDDPLRFVQWKLLAAAWASLEIDCQPAVCELFAGCARECPSLDLLRRERDGHLNCSTETLTAVLALRMRQLSHREHILNQVEESRKTRPHVLEPVLFRLAFPRREVGNSSKSRASLKSQLELRCDLNKVKSESSSVRQIVSPDRAHGKLAYLALRASKMKAHFGAPNENIRQAS